MLLTGRCTRSRVRHWQEVEVRVIPSSALNNKSISNVFLNWERCQWRSRPILACRPCGAWYDRAGYATGRIYSRSGELLASTAQEGVVRVDEQHAAISIELPNNDATALLASGYSSVQSVPCDGERRTVRVRTADWEDASKSIHSTSQASNTRATTATHKLETVRPAAEMTRAFQVTARQAEFTLAKL